MARLWLLLLVLAGHLSAHPVAADDVLGKSSKEEGPHAEQLSAERPSNEGKEEKNGDQVSKVAETQNTCISLMLVMAVGFMMANFYLVNHSDKDIRLVSWRVISATISIFAAVLIFQAIHGCLKEYLLSNLAHGWVILADMVHLFLWLGLLQLALAWNTGAFYGREEIGVIEKKKQSLEEIVKSAVQSGVPEDVISDVKSKILEEIKRTMGKVQLDTKSWAIPIGHISGFAAISAFGNLQQLPVKLGWDLAPTAVFGIFIAGSCFVALHSLYSITEFARNRVATQDDGCKDDFEVMWDDECRKTEDDIIALAVSWFLVQVARLLIVGELPGVEGADAEDAEISSTCFVWVLVFGFLAAGVSVTKSAFIKTAPSGDGAAAPDRVSVWLREVLSMTFAWSTLFAVSLFLKTHLEGAKDEDSSLLTLCAAISTSVVAVALIFILDKLADADWTDEDVDEALRACISSFGILIGFAWERCFDTSVGGIAKRYEETLPAPVIKLILAICLASFVIPAWKHYILKNTIEEENKEQERYEHLRLQGHHDESLHQGYVELHQPLHLEASASSGTELHWASEVHQAHLAQVEARWKQREKVFLRRISDLEIRLSAEAAPPASRAREFELEAFENEHEDELLQEI